MPLTPPLIYSELVAARASGGFPFAGVQFDQLAMGVSSAVASWALGQPQNVFVVGVATGAVGGGIIAPPTTKMVVAPNVPIMVAAFKGAGFIGPLGTSLSVVMAQGLGNAFSKYAQCVAPVVGVGVGQAVLKIVNANPAPLVPLIIAACTGTLGGGGPMLATFATGLANGLAGMLLTGTGTGTVTGVPGPAPAVGSSQGVLV